MIIKKKVRELALENVKIIFRNFSGEEKRFNAQGVRNFCILLQDDVAATLKEEGWNIKVLKPRDEDELPQAYMQVKVNYGKGRPPRIMLITPTAKTMVVEATVNMMDWVDIDTADIIINPYEWEVEGSTGIKAYLKTLYVTLVEDRFAEKYRDIPLQAGDDDAPPWDD